MRCGSTLSVIGYAADSSLKERGKGRGVVCTVGRRNRSFTPIPQQLSGSQQNAEQKSHLYKAFPLRKLLVEGRPMESPAMREIEKAAGYEANIKGTVAVMYLQQFLLYYLLFLLFFLKICFLNSITFITAKNTTSMPNVSTGFTGASVARSMRGKPKTIAGKF